MSDGQDAWSCPYRELPSALVRMLRYISELSPDTPLDLITLDLLSAAATAVEPLFEVRGLNERTMPLSFFMLALAPPTVGKGTSYSESFAPFLEVERERYEANLGRPRTNARDELLLGKCTMPALMECLDGLGRSTSMQLEEGMVFLTCKMMNRADIATLNQIWSRITTKASVARKHLTAMEPGLCLGIRAQTDLFLDLDKSVIKILIDGGFIARCFVLTTNKRQRSDFEALDWATLPKASDAPYRARLRELIDAASGRASLRRATLVLSPQAEVEMRQIHYRLNTLRNSVYAGSGLAVGRAWENTLRLAGIFHAIASNDLKITAETVQRAWKFVRWSLDQHRLIFGEQGLINAKPRVIQPQTKLPRPLEDGKWLMTCLQRVSTLGTFPGVPIEELIELSDVRGPRLRAAINWLILQNQVRINRRYGQDYVMLTGLPIYDGKL